MGLENPWSFVVFVPLLTPRMRVYVLLFLKGFDSQQADNQWNAALLLFVGGYFAMISGKTLFAQWLLWHMYFWHKSHQREKKKGKKVYHNAMLVENI